MSVRGNIEKEVLDKVLCSHDSFLSPQPAASPLRFKAVLSYGSANQVIAFTGSSSHELPLQLIKTSADSS